MKRKIAFFLPSFNVGGIERIMINYANTLTSSEDVYIIVCTEVGNLKSTVSNEVRIINLGNIRLRNSYFKLRNLLKYKKFDSIITGGDMPNIILICAAYHLSVKPKIIISQHNFFNIEQKRAGLWAGFSEYMMRWIYPKADGVIAVSNGIREYLINKIKINPSKVQVIYNAINADNILSRSQEDVEDLPNNYIVYIGRLSIVKNLSLLLEAFDYAKLGDTKLLIIGDGDQRKNLEKQVNNMHKSKLVKFIGEKSNPYPYLKHAKVLALASFSESFSLAVLEAITLNINVVTTPTQGPMEILTSCNNKFVTTGFSDPKEYANLLEQAYNTDCVYPLSLKSKFNLYYSTKQLLSLIK